MSVRRGKRRRRERRAIDSAGAQAQPTVVESGTSVTEKRGRRGPKPLAERSPIFPAILAVICFGGAAFTVAAYGGNTRTTYLLTGMYVVLGAIQTYLAYRILRARGGWR